MQPFIAPMEGTKEKRKWGGEGAACAEQTKEQAVFNFLLISC